MTIAASQYAFRRQYVAAGNDPAELPYRAPLFPLAPIGVILLNLAVFLGMAFDPTQRLSLAIGLGIVPVCYVVYFRFVKPRAEASAA